MRVDVWENDSVKSKPSHERLTSAGPYRIVITPQSKRRYLCISDEWPILYRVDVPNLSDDEWFASPGKDWRLAERRDDEAS